MILTDELTAQERTLLELTATPAATLLGAASMILRTTLFSEDPAAWVDMWQARPGAADHVVRRPQREDALAGLRRTGRASAHAPTVVAIRSAKSAGKVCPRPGTRSIVMPAS